MNSFNHYAYGAIGDWLYQVVAGLNTDEEQPGYKHIQIKPHMQSGLDYAHTTHESMYGTVHSGWRLSVQGSVEVSIIIPANTTATVELPTAKLDQVMENNTLLADVDGILEQEQAADIVRLQLGSGAYTFTYPTN